MADEQPEALRRLEEQLDRATQAAERLIDEAAGTRRPKPPPSGWQIPRDESTSGSPGPELDALRGAVRALRELIPPEALHRLAEALREVLLAIRALIDFYIERLERRGSDPPEVKDIPIR